MPTRGALGFFCAHIVAHREFYKAFTDIERERFNEGLGQLVETLLAQNVTVLNMAICKTLSNH